MGAHLCANIYATERHTQKPAPGELYVTYFLAYFFKAIGAAKNDPEAFILGSFLFRSRAQSE